MAAQINQVKAIIQADDPKLLEATARELGQELAAKDLTNSQIRNIFGTARQIEARRRSVYLSGSGAGEEISATRRELILLKPKLAYQAARHNKAGLNMLRDWLTAAIDAVVESGQSHQQDDERFQRFMEFFEAVLAYHYAAESSQQASQRRGNR